MWRATLVVPAIAVALILAAPSPYVEAKAGITLVLTPDAGEAGTTVKLSSDFWTPDADIEVYAGFTDVRVRPDDGNFVEPDRWLGPIAEARSDERSEFSPQMGRWSVTIDLDADGLELPDRPGFVMIKAVTEGSATVTGKSEVTDFALSLDGELPDGAGGINLTVSVASGIGDESFLYTIAAASSDSFYYPYAGNMHSNRLAPFETTRRRLSDGDYYVYVRPVFREVVGAGAFEQVHARLCFSPSYCEQRQTLTVKRVSVRDGEYADVEFILDEAGAPLEIVAPPSAGTGTSTSSGAPLLAPMLGAAATGTALLLLGARLLSRRSRFPD